MDKPKNKPKISDNDLYNNKYYIETLIHNINYLYKKKILNTQKLTAEFCVKYILDMDIESGSEDSYIYDKNYILNKQSHITAEDFMVAYILENQSTNK